METSSDRDEAFMREAISLARSNVDAGGRPFGAVLVHDGNVRARGVNETHATQDPTAHAELLAIRFAAQATGRLRLDGSTVYASGHPCPMCLAAMQLCGVGRVFYAYSNEDGKPYGLSSDGVYARMGLSPDVPSMPLVQLRPAGEEGLYDDWERRRTRG